MVAAAHPNHARAGGWDQCGDCGYHACEAKESAMSPSFVACIWRDAWVEAETGISLKDAGDKHKPTIMETRGWLLYEDADGVSIAAERCLDPGEDYYRGRTYIPKVLIQSIKPLNAVKPRGRKHAPASTAHIAAASTS